MSGTDIGYAVLNSSILCTCYAMSGTDIGYGATQPPALKPYVKRNAVRYLPTRLQCDVRY
eukprot:232261-Rhodomonas_salina.2